MVDFAGELESLFDDAPRSVDSGGALDDLLAEARPLGIVAVFLVTPSGCVMSCSPADQLSTCARLAGRLAAEATRLGNDAETLKCRLQPEKEATVTLLGLSTAGDVTITLALVHDAASEFKPSAAEIERIRRAGCAAIRVMQSSDEIRMLRARAGQLEAELWTVRQSQAEAVTWLLNEREEHLQAKRAHIVQLESEVKKRSAALREAVDKAEGANKAKSEFLTNISHEIRTPMNAILGFCESLTSDDLSETERSDALLTIRRNGMHLLELINDILDISKIEAGKLDVMRTACSPLREIGDVVGLMRHRADEKNLTLSARFDGPIPETVQTDPLRLRQILINLLGNAIKFTSKGGVELRVSLINHPNRQDAMLKFDVADTGIGIAPEHQTSLFTPFGQVNSGVTREHGGTGLGLSICRRLAELLGGSISLTSDIGVGSTFTATIDVGPVSRLTLVDGLAIPTKPDDTGIVSGGATPTRLDGIRVLIAEDGIDNQRLIRAILQKSGAEVVLAANGREAVDQMRASRGGGSDAAIDIVLMDMQMPVLDGYSATSLMRAEGVRTPIVALTAHAMHGERERCLAAGCTEYLSKPTSRRVLLDTIRKLVSRDKSGLNAPSFVGAH